jgi:hypothetical protein
MLLVALFQEQHSNMGLMISAEIQDFEIRIVKR